MTRMGQKFGIALSDLGHALVLATADADQGAEAFDDGPIVRGIDKDTLGFVELQPHESVVRDDLRKLAPAGPAGGIDGKQARTRDALRDEGQLLPEAGIAARDRAARRGDD